MAGENAASRYFDPPGPRILAHRGLALAVPENTIAAFQAAVDVGAVYLETDAHATADGVAVLVHDPEIVADGVSHPVRNLTLSQLRQLDLGGGHRVPTLAGALVTFPNARFNIDVKAEQAAGPVVRAILAERAVDRVLLTSFDEARRTRAIDSLPGVASSASSERFARAFVGARVGSVTLVRSALGGIRCVQIPEKHRNLRLVTGRSVRAFHRAGVEVHVWTVNEPDDMHRLLDLGVDGLITDRADVALPLVADRAIRGRV
ncbi:glycerophosphodiester phosphodiesterase family protein [Mycetocola sp. 2940]|uniref:glycerophosphodiester phosphodiesterase family protein n=1 Tax=Mycetocola sp. 2940 TaxID=3156452 RepID=UPI003391AF83